MKTYICLFFLLFCSVYSWGQSLEERMATAIDIGTYSEPFTYEDTQSTANFNCGFIPPTDMDDTRVFISKDIFYKLTVTQPMKIRASAKPSITDSGTVFLLNSSGILLSRTIYVEEAWGDYGYGLLPGVYYLVAKPNIYEGYKSVDAEDVTIYVKTTPRELGEDFYNPFELGTFGENFALADSANTIDYQCDYNASDNYWDNYSRHDVVYRFTLTEPMEICLDDDGTECPWEGDSYSVHLLSALHDPVVPIRTQKLGTDYELNVYDLGAGTYYIYVYADTPIWAVYYRMNLSGRTYAPGVSFSRPIDIGSRADSFQYTDVQNSELMSGNFPEKAGNEVFYRLEIENPMELTVDNCGSEVADTYLKVFSQTQKLLYFNDDSDGDGACANAKSARIHIPVLLPGVYYIVTDAEKNGNISLSINGRLLAQTGDTKALAIDAGTYKAGLFFSDTRDTSVDYTDAYPARPANDVFYKLVLQKEMDVVFSHCGSELEDTYMSILNGAGELLYSNDDYAGEGQCENEKHARIEVKKLPSGTYYVVSEGSVDNGRITTTIEAPNFSDALCTTEGQPCVITLTPTVSTDDLSQLHTCDYLREIQYFDHFGNPSLHISHGFTPYKTDLLTLQEYDGINRESKLWLPVAESTGGSAFLPSAEVSEAVCKASYYEKDSSPFSSPEYDSSSLNRIVKKYGPGVAWQNHPVKTDVLTNIERKNAVDRVDSCFIVCRYRIKNDSLVCAGEYDAGTLEVVRTIDEDNHVSYEFKDKAGRIVLVRQSDDNQISYDTYHVYDNYGNLCMMLPPMAADYFFDEGEWSETAPVLQQYAYIYHYDKYNRCIYKKLPGCDPVYTVYDAADHPVFTQDGEQRERNEWSFSIPDAFGRTVLTGVCTNTLDYVSNSLDTIVVYADWAKEENGLKGYQLKGVTLESPCLLSANYYDHYEFLGKNGIPNDMTTVYVEETGYGKRNAGGCKGQLTGIWTSLLSARPGTFTYSVMYYDDRYRIIQQRGNNELGGTEIVHTAYNFSGNPLEEKRIHTVPGTEPTVELHRHTYDHANRLLKTSYQLNDNTPIVLVDNVYDEIGRLKTDKRNGVYELRTDYTYNLRSWIKGINGPLFNQTLNYQETLEGTTPCYNGNISRMCWRSVENGMATVIDPQEKGYSFTYDGLSRLKDAIYGEGTNLKQNRNRFNEQITGYDKMGNILGLLRYGQTGTDSYGLVDNLNLIYHGNQLQSVYDNATNSVFGNGMEFKDNVNETVEYEYDKNGNLAKDLNKKISEIQYNILNLPSHISFADGSSIEYEYAADGRKVRTTHTINNNVTSTVYCGNAIYENGSLKMLLNEAGYYSFQDNKFHFCLKDHQGNVRVVTDEAGNVDEVNDYYPFGGLMSNGCNNVQPYKYNGKELDQKGGLDWYDYGARMYDATLGRFMKTDRFLEKYVSLSPYQYGANNPVNNIDINGDSIWYTLNDNIVTMHVTAKIFNNSSDNINMKRAAKDIVSDIKSTYEGEFEWSDGKTYNLKVDMDLKVVTSMKDVESADHLFVLADSDGEGVRGVTSMSGGKVMTLASRDFANNNLLSNNLSHNNTFTATHEFGHAAGLLHSKNPFNIMKQGGVFHNSNSTQRKVMLQQQYNINRGSNSLNYMNRKIPYPYVHYDNNIVDVYSLGLKWR